MNTENQKKLEDYKNQVKEFSEVELFFYIDGIGGILWREAHDYADDRFEVTEEVFKENQEYYQAMQSENSQKLPEFGIDPETTKDRPNGDYWKWYNHWKSWMNSFSNIEWEKFNQKLNKKEPQVGKPATKGV